MIKQITLQILLSLPTTSLIFTQTPLQQLFDAIENNKPKQIDCLLKKNTINLNKPRIDGLAPINLAASLPSPQPRILQKLIHHGANPNLQTTCRNFINHPLLGNQETSLHLLMLQAYPIMMNSSYKNLNTLKIELQNIILCLQVILSCKKTNVNAVDDKRRTPLDIIKSVSIGKDQKVWAPSEYNDKLNYCCSCKFFKANIIAILQKHGGISYKDLLKTNGLNSFATCIIL